MTEQFSPPVQLSKVHDLSHFCSGDYGLDEWLKKRALKNMHLGATKTYVLCPVHSNKVIGYYGLSMGQILATDVTGSMRRNMPKTIPCILLGRLAIDQHYQSMGLGGRLLKNAVERSKDIAN